MGGLFLQVFTLSATTSMVLLPLLLLLPRLRHRYAPRTCYFLWLLLALRLLLPVELPAAVTLTVPADPVVPLLSNHQAAMQSLSAQGETVPVNENSGERVTPAAPQAATAEQGEEPLTLTALAAWVWMGVGLGLLAWHALSYWLTRRALCRGEKASPEAEGLLLEQCRALGMRSVPRLRVGRTDTPVMLGLIKPVIVLPAQPMDGEDLALVFRHELIHRKRWDVAYKGLMLLCTCVHWFNPLVWWLGREAGRNLELCCDDAVLKGGGAGVRRRYGELLLQTAAGRALPFSTRFGGGKRQLKDRLANLFEQKRNSAALVGLVLAAALLSGGLVACGVDGASQTAGVGPSPQLSQAEATPAVSDWETSYDRPQIFSFSIIPRSGMAPYAPTAMEPDRVGVDTMGEVLCDETLPGGTQVVCYWEPGSEYTKYWAIRSGEQLLRFCEEDSGYAGPYRVEPFTGVLGRDGFRIEGPRGAAYYAYDYYILDETGTPRLLAACANQVVQGDLNGDGVVELLWFYHSSEAVYLFRQGDTVYEANLNARVRAVKPQWEEIWMTYEGYDPGDGRLSFTYREGETSGSAVLSIVGGRIRVDLT